ncbi:glycosyltransferase family 2 protein [Puniceibacterium sp. IMCC21224]|uniref:glycosyltransferase family 2 protein n=1 Tax=Puniceibacterium sp. IMCC21224 TaxID=1618204 RepID=UPI001E3AAF00|nr:glycosyltransferase family 2 protein [Puniceibacterium sp. IMCC21224]
MSSIPPPQNDDAGFGALLHQSGLFDALWYQHRYGDVARGRLDPLSHYLRLGAALGRAPGPLFNPQAYLAANPDVAAAGVDPLRHYLTAGRIEQRPLHPPTRMPDSGPAARVSHLRALLETGGCSIGPEAALGEHAQSAGPEAALAAEVLALWTLRQGDYAAALRWFARCPGARLDPLRIVALVQAGDRAGARRTARAEMRSGDLDLATTWLAQRPAARLACLNAALGRSGLAPVRLGPGAAPLLDRLISAAPPAARGTDADAPLVSVILAAHNAAATLPTAIRSVLGQSWRAIELLVVDDASTDDTAAIAAARADGDPRLRLIRLPRNRGAYGARNAGLAAARGRYVTLHDADDWAHPERIAQQVGFLHTHGGYAGCLSMQARMTDDLKVSRWTGTGALIHENLSSLMLPVDLVRDTLGGWDRVRVSADSELLRRVRRIYGNRAVPVLPGGPLALQRDGTGNATQDAATGMGWFYYGARREYYEAQLAHHASATSLRYDPDADRPFAAPAILDPDFVPGTVQHLDRVYAGLLSLRDSGLDTLLTWLDADRIAGRRVGLVPLYGLGQPVGGGLSIHPELRARIDGDRVRVLCFGETAETDALRFPPGQEALADGLRYLPVVLRDGQQGLPPAPPVGGAG